LFAVPANASLTTFATFNGTVGLSTDGWGSLGTSGSIHAFVPAGSTVIAAYLYTSLTPNQTVFGDSLNGSAVSFGPRVVNPSINLSMARADVTSIVAPVINGGPGGTYTIPITETNSAGQDGEALVVVYSNAALPNASVGILDGFSAVGGDTSMINFSTPLDPTASGFFAEMRIGDGFSCCGQASTISVNGTTITNNAGNDDDGTSGDANGDLITVGGNNDPFSPLLPTYAQDHERYNLIPEITTGDTSINVHTNNPSRDDNIFLETFFVSGDAGFNAPPPSSGVPEPGSVVLFGTLAAAIAFRFRRKAA
jgi:hypothetical protein